MATIERDIQIRAPVAQVFGYLSEPMSTLEWMAGMMEVRNVTGSGAGLHYHWKYKMVGIPFQGETTFTEHVPYERLVTESKGGILSTWTFTFAEREGGTELGMHVDYTIPIPVLGKLAEELVLKRNGREADLAMQNIKERLET